jgi:hypothetical protein
VARCPHLGLEEPGTSPFPFPSPSHHCYVSLPGVAVGQREQRRYCLTRRYTSCPLFPSPPLEEPSLAVAAELALTGAGIEEATSSRPPEPVAGPEEYERPVGIPVAVQRPETAPESVTREAAREPFGPAIEREMIPEQHPRTGAAVEEIRLAEQPAPVAGHVVVAKTAPGLRRALRWAAAGVAVVALACIGALAALYLTGPLSRISLATLQLPSLGPSSLLLLSGVSFAGAAALLGLLLWSRRGSAG